MTEKVLTNRSVSAIVLQCYDCWLQEVKEIKLHLPTQTCCYHSSASYFLMSRTLKTSKHESWCLIWMTQLILILNCLYHHPTSNTTKHKCQQICNIHRLSNELLVNMMMRRFHWFCNIAILCVHLWYPVTIQSMCTTYMCTVLLQMHNLLLHTPRILGIKTIATFLLLHSTHHHWTSMDYDES